MNEETRDILRENARRRKEAARKFDPVTGEGSTGERFLLFLSDYPIKRQYLPASMRNIPLIRELKRRGSLKAFLESIGAEDAQSERLKVMDRLTRLRNLHDFPFWAAAFVKIKNKGGGDDVPFRLTRPQRKFVEFLEERRLKGLPIRVVLLKARQWGGSTTSQMYMAWLQLVHRKGLNSLIIAHQGSGSDEIKDMFDRMMESYPIELLSDDGGPPPAEGEKKTEGVGKSGNITRVPRRNCKIKIGTAERPDSCRGGDYNLVHLSEVGIWKKTDGKNPEDIVRSACSGILLEPYTMIVYESTANGTGNFFQKEYDDAKSEVTRSQFEPLFVSWFDIDIYSKDFVTEKEITDLGEEEASRLEKERREAFARRLIENRDNALTGSRREEPGKYLWSLWKKGATLEAINWYVMERAKYNDHGQMASEYPSDDVEAFVNSGARVFDAEAVQSLRPSCKAARWTGDMYADGERDEECLRNIRFVEDRRGLLRIWEMPDIDPEERILNRYLVVVDIGGESDKADYSVIAVFDRLFMMEGGKPAVVAQWYGHIEMHRLAWKACQIAAFYDDALLVIESNTLETKDRDRDVDGDQSGFVLNRIKDVYDNLYARSQSEEDIREGRPRKYGFHTNTATKPLLISTLREAVSLGLYVERDERCLDEYLTYEKRQNGSFGAIEGKHDDLLMTRGIGLHVCFREMDPPTVAKKAVVRKRKKIVSAATI